MGNSNDGIWISAQALLGIGQHGIAVGLDTYYAGEEAFITGFQNSFQPEPLPGPAQFQRCERPFVAEREDRRLAKLIRDVYRG